MAKAVSVGGLLRSKVARRTTAFRTTCAGPTLGNGLFKLGLILGRIGRVQRQQKITLVDMREYGPRRLIAYCGDYKCAHSVVVDAGRWSDKVRLSDLEPLFVCKACGHRGADTRPLFENRRMGTG